MLDDGTRKYTPGVSSRNGSTSTFQHSGLKNATEQSNSSQSVTASRKYDAFGNVQTSSGTWQGPFGYAGSFGYQEDPNGLKLLGHRYYDSATGRFLTSDPIGDGSNWYAYAGSNPVSLADPSGLGTPPILGFLKGVGQGLWGMTTFAGIANGIETWGRVFDEGPVPVIEDMVDGVVHSYTDLFFSPDPEAKGRSLVTIAATLLGGAKTLGAKVPKCFAEGTDVAMADGSTKKIEDVEVGDEVATWDPATGERTTSKVART